MIIAHRGASGIAPENTMLAFELAYREGAQAIELDVHLTKDHVPVVIHDEKVDRTTNGYGFVKDLTFKEIQMLEAGTWFDRPLVNIQIPSLETVLLWAKSRNIIVNIELKTNKINYEQIEMIVYEQVASHNLLDRTIFSSFNPKSLETLSSMKSDLNLALITSKLKSYEKIKEAKHQLNINALHCKYSLVNKRFIHMLHHLNLKARVYTVNRISQILKCYSLSLDGVITDFPRRAKYTLQKMIKNRN